MNSKRGRNSGVTGLVDFRGGTPAFTVDVWKFRQKLTTQNNPRAGRGDGPWANEASRAFSPGASLVLSGLVVTDGYPLPAEWKGQEGSLELTFHKDAKQTLEIRVVEAEVTLTADRTAWEINLAAIVLEDPVLEGFEGTATAATVPTPSDKELWGGIAKVYDPQNLLTSATTSYELWPVTDTDAAENTRLAALVAGLTSRFTGAKVKTARLLPGRIDDAATVAVEFSLTDTAEDVVNPRTSTTLDPDKLTSRATAAAINGTPTSPGGDFVARETTTQELHDAATLSVTSYGLRDTEADIEMPGSPRRDDPTSGLDRLERHTLVTDSATRPTTPTPVNTGLVLRSVEWLQENNVRWRHTFVFGPVNAEQEINFPASPTEDDPSDLTDRTLDTDVTDSSTPHASSPPAGLKLRRTESVRLTDSGKWKHTHEYARRNTEDDVEMDGSVVVDDPSDLTERTEVCVVTASGTPPASSAPAGLVARRVTSKQLHDTRWAHTWEYGRRSTEDDVEMEGSHILDDASDLGDGQVITEVQGSVTPSAPSTPSGLKLRETRTEQLHASKWKHTFVYARRNREDDVEMDGTETVDDPSDLLERATVTSVTGSSSPPASSAPAGLVARKVTTKQLHDAKWSHTWEYGRRSSEDDVEMPGSHISDDPSNLADEQAITEVQASVTPTPPSTPSGLKLRETRTEQLHASKWKHTFLFARATREDDLEMGASQTLDCASDLGDRQVISVLHTSASPAGVLPSTPSGLKLRETITRQQHDGAWLHTFVFERTNREDDAEMPAGVTEEDPSNLVNQQAICLVTASSSTSAPSAPTGLVLRETHRVQLHDSRYKHVFRYARRTTEEDYTVGKWEVVLDPSALESTGTVVQVTQSATPPTAPATPVAGAKLVATRTEQIHNQDVSGTVGKWAHTFRFGPRTSEDDLLMPLNVTEVDPSGLESRQQKASLSGTPTLDAGYQQIETVTRTLKDGKTLVVVKGGPRTTEQDVEYGGSRASWSLVEQRASRVVEVVDDTGSDLEDLATAYGEANKTDLEFESVVYERLTAAKVKRTVTKAFDGQLIFSRTMGSRRPVLAFAGATVYVHLCQKLLRAASSIGPLYSALVLPQSVHVQEIEFTLRRRVLMADGDTLPFMNPLWVGRSNNASFLGLPAFKVAFNGAEIQTNLSVPAPRVVNVDLKFRYSNLGVFDESGIIPGWSTGNYNIGGASNGTWVAANLFGWTASPAASMSFNVFLP